MVAALTASLAFAALAGWTYLDARDDSTVAYSTSRDAALKAGRTQIAALSTLDAAHPDAALRTWLDASTGPLHDELRRTGAGKPTTSARGSVTDAAVTELDDRSGTAKLIATVQVQLAPAGGAATTDRKRLEAALERTASGWKLKALSAVPVTAP
uniref:Mce-associated membrane protein n=1 Tax=Streptomyces sp. NBC_00003 TaxID=2903608 RepID=A0AAU2VGC1_9ACTN